MTIDSLPAEEDVHPPRKINHDPLLDVERNKALEHQQQAGRDVQSVPAIVTTASSPSCNVSKLTGLCRDHGICDCSQFEDKTTTAPQQLPPSGGRSDDEAALLGFDIGTPHAIHHPLLPEYSRYTSHWTTTSRLRSICIYLYKNMPVGGLVCFVFVSVVLGVLALFPGGTQTADTAPTTQRWDRLRACSQSLVPNIRCPTLQEDTPKYSNEIIENRCIALGWFLGPGGKIGLDDCSTWESDFGRLFSLLILRESLGIEEFTWHNTLTVASALQVCSWKRIGCNDEGRVNAIYLNHANLNGTIPNELMGLQDVQELWLYSNDAIRGSIPTQMGQLTLLEILELQETSLTGTIPTELGQLSHLRDLFVDRTLLRGDVPPEICSLSSLENVHANCKGLYPMVRCACCTKCKSKTAF